MTRFSWALAGCAALLLAGGINLAERHHAAVKRAEAARQAATETYAEVSAYSPAALLEAQKEGRPILVAVQSSRCPTCAAQAPAIQQMAADKSYKGLRVLLVDFETQKEALRDLGATMQSTLVVFLGKREVARSVGVTDTDAIKSSVRRTLI
jgi:thiol-disulfide isomerase/thioredoxin